MKTELVKERLVLSALVSTFLTFNLCVFGPIELYINNLTEFWFSISDILWQVIICGIILFAILTAIGILLKGTAHNIIVAIIFGLGLGFYIQGNFMNAYYGVLDGTMIDWSKYTGWAIINTIIWCICIAIPFVLLKLKKELFIKVLKYVSLLVIIIQILTLGILLISTDFNEKASTDYSLTEEKMFELSSNKNIVIFILDAFDAEIFSEALEQYSEYQEIFSDFTWFANTLGGATRTKIALPYILTGEVYNTPVSYMEYIRNSYKKTPLYKELEANNYDTRILTSTMFVDPKQNDLINNISLISPEVSSYTLLTKYLYKFTAYRYMPHLLKQEFWMYSGDFDKLKKTTGVTTTYTINDPAFFQALINKRISLSNKGNCFRLYHLMGAHAPYNMNEYAEKVDAKNSSELQQAQGALYIVKEYMKQLKKLNIYDDTMIMVMADHGVRGLEQNPLLLVKRFGETKQFSISQSPISYADLQPTLLSMLTEDYSLFGRTFFEITENEERERFFYVENSSNNEVNIIEYVSTAKARDVDSLFKTGNTYHGNTRERGKKYKWGTVLLFTTEATANQYCISGFSKNEGTHTWTSGKSGQIELSLAEMPTNNLMVNFKFRSINGNQTLIAKVGDTVLYDEMITSGTIQVKFAIPASLITGNKLVLNLEYPDAISPHSLGQSNDNRELAFAMESMCIDTKE